MECIIRKMSRHIEDLSILTSRLNIDASYRVEMDNNLYLISCILKEQSKKNESKNISV